MECGAQKRGKPGTCKKPAMPNGRCRLHGGLSLAGPASPRTSHGRYSRYLPNRLVSRYTEAQSDAELVALREEIALTDARLSDLLVRVNTGEAGLTWAALGAAIRAYRVAEAKGAKGYFEQLRAFDLIEQLAAEGRDDYAAWDEVHKLIEQRRRLAETEFKRLKEMQQMITAERAMILLGAVVAVIRTHVTDRDTLGAISRDIGRLVANGTGSEAGPGE